MAAVVSRQISETDDEVLHKEMSPLLEPLSLSGQHVLLAAQKLSIQPSLSEHREELIIATQSVFLGVVKVLLVNDDASVRRVVAAADQVLESLHQIGSSSDIKSLLRSFQVFSEVLLHLNRLTTDRANSLQDPGQTKQLLNALETLRRCISMLHTAMCTTIKHPTSEQAQVAKTYILEKVQSTVRDITETLMSDNNRRPMGPRGYYTIRHESLLQLLTSSSVSLMEDSGFDSMIRDIVFHCMMVANSTQRECQQRVVSHCRHILQFWSDLKFILKYSDHLDHSEGSFEKTCTLLVQQIQMLDKELKTTILYQVMDMSLEGSSIVDKLLCLTRKILVEHCEADVDLTFVQSIVEDFISHADRITQVANFTSAIAEDSRSLENVENSRACLTRLRAQIPPLSLELSDNSVQTIQKLHDVCQKWEEETYGLLDAVTDVMDVREFTNLAINEMVNDRHGCDAAFRKQNHKLFDEHAKNLMCHMKLVVRSVRRHLDRSSNPIYRNGLLTLLKQVDSSQTKLAESVRHMLFGSSLNVEIYSQFTDNASTAIQHSRVLREGLDGHQHPDLLSPLRQLARKPEITEPLLPVKDTCGVNLGHVMRASDSPVFEVLERDSQVKQEEDHSDVETIEAVLARKYDGDDLKMPAVPAEPELIHKPLDFNLLPLLYEVVTVTKEKDVSVLNQACTSVLRLSNCYAQAAKEALAIADAVDSQTLESFRAELVSLTPLLIQTAQETAMSSVMRTKNIYKYSTQFSDLINNIRKVLLPVAGTWYHAAQSELQGNLPAVSAGVIQGLNDVMTLSAEVVQLLASSDLNLQTDRQEAFSILHSKLNKAQNNTKDLVEFLTTAEKQGDQLDSLCVLWGVSVQILLHLMDRILVTSASTKHLSSQKQLTVLSENSLRTQEAARLTSLNSKSTYKSKQLTSYQNELKTLTEIYLKAADELDIIPNLIQLAKSEFLQRHLLIKIRVLSGQLSKENKEYSTALESFVKSAYYAAKHFRGASAEDMEQQFETTAQTFLENVKYATNKVEDCLNYIRDPHSRSNLRSINDHLSSQISEIISRAKLIVQTHYICDTLSLDVQIQCWSAKAHYVVEEIRKQDGIHQETIEHIKAGLQGRESGDINKLPTVTCGVTELQVPDTSSAVLKKGNTNSAATARHDPEILKRDGCYTPNPYKDVSSLTNTSLYLKQRSNSWDPKDNRIVQETRKMADIICHMTQYLKKKGPLLNKEAFVSAARDVISNCQSVTQFIRIIANHSLDKQCTEELSLIIEQILTITNQLSIISSVNAVTPGSKSSDEILVKNVQNLLQTVLRGVHAAETACITGLRQPEPNSDGEEATALCFQWKRNLEIHRAQQTSNLETDELGLRKTSVHPLAPSLAPKVNVKDNSFKL